MDSTQFFPLDFDSLQKGDVIAPEKVEDFANVKRGTDGFNLAMLALKERIVRECRDRGKHFTVAVVKGQLRILTDEEATIYNARNFKAGFRRSGRCYKRLSKVDTSKFNEAQKQDHDRNLLTFGKMLQAARAARVKVAALSHQRNVPGLPPPASNKEPASVA